MPLAAFIAAANCAPAGAHVFNLHGESVTIRSVVDLIHRNAETECITIEGDPLPIPPHMVDDAIHAVLPDLPRTPLEDGVRETMAAFRRLRDEDRLPVGELEG